VFNVFTTRVVVQEGNALDVPAEGLLIAANDHLWMGGQTAQAIKETAGEAVEAEAVRQGPVAVGSAVATGAGELSHRRIYHTVVMGQDLKARHDQIRPALQAALDLARQDGITSLVITALESEEMLSAFHDAAREIATALFEILSGENSLQELTLMASSAEAKQAYRDAFLQVLRQAAG